MNETKRQHYLKEMGIDIWKLRQSEIAENNSENTETVNMMSAVKENKIESQAAVVKTAENPIAEMSWEELKKHVDECTRCPLYKTRTQAVFGVGNRNADLLVVGEAPGANEDKQGEPFVGRGGRLLNSMLKSIGLDREMIYIANILKSRPPNNRDPAPEEVAACTPYLQRQIVLLQPKLILAVGRIAAQFLLSTNESMANLRGREFFYGDLKTPLIVTYHPAYLLRSPREKRKAWGDMLMVEKKIKALK